jgi:hypothetical protein
MRDLRKLFGAVRDQGDRPTCLAFAVSDVHGAARGMPSPMSAEHLYYHAVQRMPARDPHAGVNVPAILSAVTTDGQCLEAGWPYMHPFANYVAGNHPPATAVPIFRREHDLGTQAITDVIAELNRDRPVLLALMITEAFCAPNNGIVMAANPGNDVDYHAIVAVGHGGNGSHQMLLVRNSWGSGWGDSGYCWIDVDYLAPRLAAVAMMGDERIV